MLLIWRTCRHFSLSPSSSITFATFSFSCWSFGCIYPFITNRIIGVLCFSASLGSTFSVRQFIPALSSVGFISLYLPTFCSCSLTPSHFLFYTLSFCRGRGISPSHTRAPRPAFQRLWHFFFVVSSLLQFMSSACASVSTPYLRLFMFS